MPHLVPKTLREGCVTTLYTALNLELGGKFSAIIWCNGANNLQGEAGAFFSDCEVFSDLLPHAVGKDMEKRLWRLSEETVGESFSY